MRGTGSFLSDLLAIPQSLLWEQRFACRGAVWACSYLNNNDESLLLTCGADNYVLLWQVAASHYKFKIAR